MRQLKLKLVQEKGLSWEILDKEITRMTAMGLSTTSISVELLFQLSPYTCTKNITMTN